VRLLLDQMLRADLADLLRSHGHEVVRLSEIGHGRADDADVLARAVRDERTLVTIDGHFGDWVVLPLSEHFGVIRVKAHPTTTENVAHILLPFLANRPQSDFRNHLIILSPGRARWIRTAS
jgi:predicted nuclease of predicted toxin-antitoxin system